MVFCLFVALDSCSSNPDWKGGEKSIPDLMQKAYEALKNNDDHKLSELTLSREEHNKLFWKHVGDKYTSDKGMNADTAYDFMSMESQLSIQTLKNRVINFSNNLQFKGCRRMEKYGPFQLHLGCEISVIDDKNIENILGNIYGVIEYSGSYKIYNYKRN